MISWKKKVKQIPSLVKIAPKVVYQVFWQKEILDTKGNQLCGFTDLDNRIITIKMDMSPKLTVETYVHECFHAFSEHFKIGLTEDQVLRMEKVFPYLDGIFEK